MPCPFFFSAGSADILVCNERENSLWEKSPNEASARPSARCRQDACAPSYSKMPALPALGCGFGEARDGSY